jgi:hypothetical protein
MSDLPSVDYTLQATTIKEVKDLFEAHHGYGSVGRVGVYVFAVVEAGSAVAAYVWQPPAPGSADAVCPEAPYGVLALSRMVATPRAERALNHVSRPLRFQMKHLIDRTRWPVLVTYSDASLGHTGHVYKCSGWTATESAERAFYEDAGGARRSNYSCGGRKGGLTRAGTTTLQRWEHRVCPAGSTDNYMAYHGWRREPIPGKVWRSGNPAYRWVRD